MKQFSKLIILFVCCLAFTGSYLSQSNDHFPFGKETPIIPVSKHNFRVDIKTIGELEAARSISIASSIKGDLGKIIDLIPDGVTVQPGQVLVRMDSTPFEEKIEKLRAQMREQEAYLRALEQALEWEKQQAAHEEVMALYELETAQLELDKISQGDGPQEMSRLKSVMQKAWLKYDELQAYSNDLQALEEQGFLNPAEIKQAQKKLNDEQEAYEAAKLQYETYVQHIFPMQIKKGEMQIKRARIHQEEINRSGAYKIAKAHLLLEQGQQGIEELMLQLKEAEKELAQTEITAPTYGMVVHREDYRSGQRRKPRVGDILVKNQPLIELPDLNSMIVKTRVREIDLYKIDVGKQASIVIDAYPNLVFNGTIISIGVLALADIGRPTEEKYFDVRVALNEGHSQLRPGMTTRVTIHAQQAKEVLAIPLHAVFDELNRSYCYVLYPGKRYDKREIQLGIHNEHWIEVKEGLQEGEQVCLLNPFQ